MKQPRREGLPGLSSGFSPNLVVRMARGTALAKVTT